MLVGDVGLDVSKHGVRVGGGWVFGCLGGWVDGWMGTLGLELGVLVDG